MTSKQVDANYLKASVQQPIKVLFIGNSYTYVNDLPWLIQQLSISAKEKRKLETEMFAVGGATLKNHWQHGEALKLLKAKQWDYIVLQEQSTLPINNPKEMYEYASLFNTEIKRVKAQTILYLTWAKQNQPKTQQLLTDSYLKLAKEFKAKVAPVGIAWQKIQESNPKLNLYDADGSHPSPVGSYVAACVFYTIFYDKSPLGLSDRIYSSQFNTPQEGKRIELKSLNTKDANIIQDLVWNVVTKMKKQ